MGRRSEADSLTCSLGHFECDGHRVHKLSQRRLTTDCLAPRESDFVDASKVCSDWLPNYVKVRPSVLDIFRMEGCIPERPCILRRLTLKKMYLE